MNLRTQQPSTFSDNAHLHTGLSTLLQNADHLLVGNLRIVNEQLLSGSCQKVMQHLPRVRGADHKLIRRGRIFLACAIGLEKPDCLLNQRLVLRNDPEAAAVVHIEMSKIKRKNVKNGAV